MKMREGERQVAPTLEGIRRDHTARYKFAARYLKPRSTVIDFACGVGYGTAILAQAEHQVFGYDNDAAALEYAVNFYGGPDRGFVRCDANDPAALPTSLVADADAALCFETIEHLEDPRPLLKALRAAAPLLIASVPNEEAMPWRINARTVTRFHHRHYTRAEFFELLSECGWRVVSWRGQQGPESDVDDVVTASSRTLIAIAERVEEEQEKLPGHGQHVAILGMGPSLAEFLEVSKRLGGRSKFCDQVWAINAIGNVIDCDLVFHMDDVRIQEIRARARPQSNIAAMLAWMKTCRHPIMTSRAHPDYPMLREFPLEEVINHVGHAYFNSTAAYAVAYAVHVGAAKISCFGMDFTYPKAHDAEKGRACVEFWLGQAAARGIKLSFPRVTSLMDSCYNLAGRLYGYDTLEMSIEIDGDRAHVISSPRAELPTAEEIESAYDHSAHPNPLVED